MSFLRIGLTGTRPALPDRSANDYHFRHCDIAAPLIALATTWTLRSSGRMVTVDMSNDGL